MKHVYKTVLATLVTIGAAKAGAQSPTNAELVKERMQGTWSVVARVCETRGNPARDNFVLGRDRMEIIVSGTDAALTTTINGAETDLWKGSINPEHGYLVMRPGTPTKMNKRIAKVPLDLTQYPTLIIATNGFEEGGSCAPGETLNTYFRLNGSVQ